MSRNTNPPTTKKRNFFEAFSRAPKQTAEKKQAKLQELSSSAGSKPPPKTVIPDPPSEASRSEGEGPRSKDGGEDEEESTDFKLAILASLLPDHPQETLLELLLTANGSVEAACQLASEAPRPKSSTVGPPTQSSLSSYLPSNSLSNLKKIPFPLPPVPKFKTIHLSTPSQVPYYAPCSLTAPFLPPSIATTLLKECLHETPEFSQYTFRLFDRNVSSPHTACFYSATPLDAENHSKKEGGYMYNGTTLSQVRMFTPTMLSLIPIIEKHVNEEIERRVDEVYPEGKRLKYMLPKGGWRVTSAFMNCYDGAKQSVGWHSDQLTYLGPRTVIASLSLGVEREFRLRRVAPVVLDPERGAWAGEEDEIPNTAADLASSNHLEGEEEVEERKHDWKWSPEGQISIHLPHNSLLIMHAECQESYKHSVHPASRIEPHPVAGDRRINITFRCYRESLRPEKLPKCKCGVGCVLKTVQRVKDRMGWYFWGCQVGNQWKDEDEEKSKDMGGGAKRDDGKDGCGYLEWAKFTEDGEPIWDQGT